MMLHVQTIYEMRQFQVSTLTFYIDYVGRKQKLTKEMFVLLYSGVQTRRTTQTITAAQRFSIEAVGPGKGPTWL